jgi:type I restriction enzyme R subunit
VGKIEAAVVAGRQNALLTMASGTGKTRTMLGIVHRFLKTGRFNRVLLLVGHSALDEQALDVFRKVKIENHVSFGEIYAIKEFDKNDKETKIHVATINSLVENIIYNTSESMPSVTDYDLIIVDEAHLEQNDAYINDYHLALEYFNAVKIALTSTPTLETTKIFGSPIFEYTHHRAATEGYLAKPNAPCNTNKKLPDKNVNMIAKIIIGEIIILVASVFVFRSLWLILDKYLGITHTEIILTTGIIITILGTILLHREIKCALKNIQHHKNDS